MFVLKCLDMKLREGQSRLQGLLKETITLLCKNGLHFTNGFIIDALIGITTDDSETFLLKLEETVGDVGGEQNNESEQGDTDRKSKASQKRTSVGNTRNTTTKRRQSIGWLYRAPRSDDVPRAGYTGRNSRTSARR